MSSKRFELYLESHDSSIYGIMDNDTNRRYNDLGCVYFTSAPALCDLLNEFNITNKKVLSLKEYLNKKISELEKDIIRVYEEEKSFICSPLRNSSVNKEYLSELKSDKRTFEYILEMLE